MDVRGGTVRKGGTHTRNLLRVKCGLDMVRVLFEQILVTECQRARLETIIAIESTWNFIGRLYSYGFMERGVYSECNNHKSYIYNKANSVKDYEKLGDKVHERIYNG